jgi:hypothetical protein
MNKGKYETMLLKAGYEQRTIDAMVKNIQCKEPDLSREEVCEAEVEAWS